jgi:hypothetical protein
MRQTAEPRSRASSKHRAIFLTLAPIGEGAGIANQLTARLDHASRLDQLEAAFKALGRSVDVSIKRAA